ncbi:MAG: DUF3467 domain-containing protein [Elusimicrobia bacterium]|nr:DUF3467 domain-containing protein [Elusimicrobiota bacterium]
MKPFKFSKKNREYIKWDKNHKQVRIFPKVKTVQEPPAQVQIEADENTAQGVYTNLAVVSNTETEFIFNFAFLAPNRPIATVLARIISSDIHTKRFCAALRENIKNYEARFGPVKD